MSQTAPTLPDAAPVNLPQRNARSTFSTRVDAFVTWFVTVVVQLGTLATNCYNNAVDCYNNAVTAAAAAIAAAASATSAAANAGALPWAAGTYAQYTAAISTIDFQTYRKITASSVTSTDPSLDLPNWTKLTGSRIWLRKTTTYTAVAGDQIRASTTAAAWSLTAPANPSDGDAFRVKDIDGTFNTHNLTILCNSSKKVMGFTTSFVIDTRLFDGDFVYDSTLGDWRL